MKNRITEWDMQQLPFMNVDRIAEDIASLLVLSPHPDDETLGCGGLIAMLRNANVKVSVVFITDGSASHTSKTHPSNQLALLREKEARAACDMLNVSTENVYFLRCQDSQLQLLSSEDLEKKAKLISELVGIENYKTIAVPWRKDPHPDHIVTTQIGNIVIKNHNPTLTKLEYPIWLWKNGKESDWPFQNEVTAFRLDITPYVAQKKSAMEQHQSQLGMIVLDDANGFVMTEELLKPFYGTHEYFFVEKTQKIDTLSDAYFDTLYEKQSDPWNFRNSDYERAKYQKSIAALGRKDFENGLELGCSVGVQTKLLAELCESLVAADISDIAVQEAKLTCTDYSNIEFRVQDVSKKFPDGIFDLITLCEIGYYFSKPALLNVFKNIDAAMKPNGRLLLVHWTGFVPDYPLTGDEVHQAFEDYNSEADNFEVLMSEKYEKFRMDVCRKL